MKIRNVVRSADGFSSRMWRDLTPLLDSASSRAQLRSEMLDVVAGIDAACSRRGATPSSLGAPSRQAYCWLKYIQSEDNLLLHLQALDRGRTALTAEVPKTERVELDITNMSSIWRRRRRGKQVLLKVNEGFVHGDGNVWQALVKNAMGKGNSRSRSLVNEYIESEQFSGVLFEMESFAMPEVESNAGQVHSLDKSFDRVNSLYFAGDIPKPRLCWNNVLTSRKFGHYEFTRDTVMLSISLDDPAVSEDLVDYVMYHELLHKKHGVKLTNGRRMAHTSGFRKEEKLFCTFDDAVNGLNALAQRHSRR